MNGIVKWISLGITILIVVSSILITWASTRTDVKYLGVWVSKNESEIKNACVEIAVVKTKHDKLETQYNSEMPWIRQSLEEIKTGQKEIQSELQRIVK